MLLLFIIGLELQPTRLWVMRRLVFGLGAAQVILCSAAAGVRSPRPSGSHRSPPPSSASACRCPPRRSCCRCSPNAGSCKTQHGRAAFGILLFQDLAVLPVLAVLPLPGRQDAEPRRRPLVASGSLKLVAVIAVVIVRRRAPGAAPGAAVGGAHPGERGVHRGRAAHGDRAPRCSRSSPACRSPSAPSSPACCWPTASSATSWRRTWSRSRACCSACSSSRWACRRTSACCDSEPLTAARRHRRLPPGQGPGRVHCSGASPGMRGGVRAPARLRAPRGRRVRVRAVHARRAAAPAGTAETADLLVLAVTLSMMLGPLLLIGYEAFARRWLTPAARPFDAHRRADERRSSSPASGASVRSWRACCA